MRTYTFPEERVLRGRKNMQIQKIGPEFEIAVRN